MQTYYSKKMLTGFLLILASCANNLTATIFTVTKTTDTYPTGQPGELRWAIQQSNHALGPNTINFNIPGSGPFIIKPSHDLDAIKRPVTINGYSQQGSSVNTLSSGNNANLLIVLSGNNYKEGNAYAGTGNGLLFTHGSAGSVVKGLVINGWINTGIFIYNANNISIVGNYIGTNQQGTAQLANQAGMYIDSANNTVIGTTNRADRNLIAGSFFYFNASACIEMIQANNTSIVNNYIGTDKTGTNALGNSLVGVECISCNSVTIGGSTTAARNIISGHTVMGLSLIAVNNSTVQNNYIGTDVTGSVARGNGNMGISISGGGKPHSTTQNKILSNVISANNIGIKLGYTSIIGANQNIIQGNYLGTNASGNAALPNNYGIVINDSSNNIINNVISGNTVGGLSLYGPATGNTIRGNYIGVNATDTGNLVNGYGIQVGLAAGLVNGSNFIINNTFGGNNTTTNLCP